MADDSKEILGTWTIKFMHWTWEYTFTPDGRVTWRDPLNNERGEGRWALTPKVVYMTWKGSDTKESFDRPIRPENQPGWYDASYGKGPLKARKMVPAQPGTGPGYSGLEPAIDLPAAPPPVDNVFYPPFPKVHGGYGTIKPIYDEEHDAIIGFLYESSGYQEFYDLTGRFLGSDEIPVEKPLLDPIDFVSIGGGIARGVGKVILRIGVRAVASAGSKAVIRGLTAVVIGGMRATFRAAISAKTLKFTAKTAGRMAIKERYVPVHLLKTAIRHGTRAADPQGVKGAFRYTLKMIKSEKNIAPGLNPGKTWAGKTYTLEVVVKEELSSNTVLHFLYE
jgi:hypothetical protein